MKAIQDLTEREVLQLSMGLIGNPKYFSSSTAKDTLNTFHVIQIIEDATFSFLTEGSEELADSGILSGIEISRTLYSKEGFTNIQISGGIIKAISINELL